jgi:hypothetical protein
MSISISERVQRKMQCRQLRMAAFCQFLAAGNLNLTRPPRVLLGLVGVEAGL